MSPERDDPTDEHEQELYEDVPPRSIFAATWFRVVLVVIVLGVVGAVAVPYVLDWMNPPPPPRSAATTTRSPMAPSTSTTPSVIDKPLGDKPASEKSTSERSAGDKPVTDKKDSTLFPAPAPPAASTPPARPEPKPSAAPTAKPAPEPKTTARATAPETKAAPAPPAEAKSKSAMAVTEAPAKPSSAKPAPAKPEAAPKSETAPATATKPSPQRQAAARATTPAPAAVGGGPYWVQVGAFKDPETAKRVATKLREENFKVEESLKRVGGSAPAAPASPKAPAVASASDQYDVFVTGMSVEDLNRRLAGKGLSAETSGGGAVVKPSLPLRDAVALSKDLAVEGFKVQVRRAGGSTAAASGPAAPAAPTEGGQALHRVRVGSFSDKAAALAAARELEAKGYKPYIARGDQ